MTYQEIEKQLIDIEQSKRYLNNLAKAIEYYRDKLESPKVASYSKSKVQASAENRQEDELVELSDLSSLYDELLTKTLNKERRIYNAINRLDLEEQNIIIEKYIHGQTWDEVAESFHYSERSIYNKRDKALKKLVMHFSLFEDFLKE